MCVRIREVSLFTHGRGHLTAEDTSQWRRLTGLSQAVQLPADSSGIDGRHADGVFSVRGQLGKQDGSFLPTNLGLVEDE